MIRVVVVDDHPVVRDGIVATLSAAPDLEVVGQAESGPEAVQVAAATRPDVVVMDLRMPRGGGVEAVREMKARGIGASVLVLTTYDTDADILAAVEAGATGYMLKDAPPDQLCEAVHTAARGQTALAPGVADRLMNRLRSPVPTLSGRELEILGLLAQGLSNRAISKRLFISEATVKTHLVHVFEKLGVDNRTAAITTALRRGLIRVD